MPNARRLQLRRVVVLAAALLAGFASAPLGAQTTVKLSHPYPTVAQHHKHMEFFKAEVEKRTGGKLKIDIFPASQLMPITQEINGILSGQIQAAFSLNTIAATIDPLRGFFEMPFVFNISPGSQKHLKDFVRSEAGGVLRKSLEAKG